MADDDEEKRRVVLALLNDGIKRADRALAKRRGSVALVLLRIARRLGLVGPN